MGELVKKPDGKLPYGTYIDDEGRQFAVLYIHPDSPVSGGGGGVTTNISTTRDASQVNILSSSGTDGSITAATTSLAGVMTAAQCTKLTALITDAISASEKGANGGVAPLDGSGKIPSVYLPAGMDDIVEYANLAAFPGTGLTGTLYLAIDSLLMYRWSGSAYVALPSGSPGSTDSVVEGSTNRYFTEARVRASLLTGLSTASATDVAATDSVLTGFGKLQAKFTAIAQTIRDTLLTGFTTASAAAVTATDSVVIAFGKLQAQMNLKANADTPTFTGTLTADGAQVIPPSTMAGNSINIAKMRNTKTLAATATLSFSATPSVPGQIWGLELTNSTGTAFAVPIPSVWSRAKNAFITSIMLPANGHLDVYFKYDGVNTNISGESGGLNNFSASADPTSSDDNTKGYEPGSIIINGSKVFINLTNGTGTATWSTDLAAVGGGGVTDGVKGDITVSGSGTVYTVAPEVIDDRVAALLVAGTNVTLSYNDAGNALTINATPGGGGGDMTLSGTQTITGAKTFNAGTALLGGSTSGAITLQAPAAAGSGTVTFPATGTLATLAGTETLTNKTLTTPTVNGGTVAGLTAFAIRSTGAAFDLSFTTASALTANRSLAFSIGDANRTITMAGNLSFAGAFTQAGAFTTTLTVTANTSVTLPTAGTLATTTAAETFTNKTLTAPVINGGTAGALTSFGIRSTGAAFDLIQATANVFTANRTLSWNIGDANRSIAMAGNLAFAGAFSTVGAFALTLTTTAATDVTLPTTGTLATLAGAEKFTNKQRGHAIPATDNTYVGDTLDGILTGAAIAQWQTVYLNSSGAWVLADSDGSSTFPCRGIAVAAAASGAAASILENGIARNNAWTWTPGAPIWLSTTPGGMTQTAPATGTQASPVGYALTATSIRVRITDDYFTVGA